MASLTALLAKTFGRVENPETRPDFTGIFKPIGPKGFNR